MSRVARFCSSPAVSPVSQPVPVKNNCNVRWGDIEQAKSRRRRAQDRFGIMLRFLTSLLKNRMNKRNMLKLADVIAAQRNVEVDRLAKRTKEMLIVWFCENAFDFVFNPTNQIFVAALASLNTPVRHTHPDFEFDLADFVPHGQRDLLNVEETEMLHDFWD
jgi:hypothetical protein